MKLSDQKQQSKRHQFDAYCKKVIKFAMINCYREKNRRIKREVLVSDLSEIQFSQIVSIDEYPTEEYRFPVIGYNIFIKNCLLSEALILLSSEKRNIILMYFYLNMSDQEIGKVVNMKSHNVNYHRKHALRLIGKYMEAQDGK